MQSDFIFSTTMASNRPRQATADIALQQILDDQLSDGEGHEASKSEDEVVDIADVHDGQVEETVTTTIGVGRGHG